jgi:oxygen-dependent protoporphyrinogen oxidase
LELLRTPSRVERDRSISEFVTDHYGREVLDYIAEPLLAGVYGGDPSQMSTLSVMPMFGKWEAKYGSLTRAARKEARGGKGPLFTTLKSGLHRMVEELVRAARPDVIRGSVDKVEKGWRVRVNGSWIECDHAVVACRASNVLPDLFPEIAYNSATVVAVGYRKTDVPHSLPGFGFLVPRVERKHLAACTWVGHKFYHRVPDDKVLLRCFMAGTATDPLPEIREKLGITAAPLFVSVAQWPASMPQYAVGHADLVKIIEEMLRDLPGLHVVGNAYHGIGMPDCIKMGRQVAERIAGISA